MIGNCIKCGNYEWDKIVSLEKETVLCPKCGYEWKFKVLPLFILTGCSGIGKTTTAQQLLQMNTDYIVMDADVFGFLGEDYYKRQEQVLAFSRNIMQCGKPLLWTMAGALDILYKTYNIRFFKKIYFLALTCDEDTLRKHMINGRGITDQRWIEGSVGHNKYLSEHDSIDDVTYSSFDITGKSVEEVAKAVDLWVRSKL